MADDHAQQVIWGINSASQGNRRIRRMQDYEVSSDGSVETVGEVGSPVMVGFLIKPGGNAVTFTIKETKGAKREIDWEFLDRRRANGSKEIFELTKQIVGGREVQHPECMVSKIDFSGDKDGKHEYTVEVVTLGEKPL
jgi:hypothetical protein